MAIADLGQHDGVYCLSGVRGSGKSSILNRIAWYCNNWYVRTRKPLLVRFDLGTNFNREVFIRDLVAEICLATKKAFRHPPFSLPFGISLTVRFLGNFGRFCQVNIPWALVASLLAAILLDSAQPGSIPLVQEGNGNTLVQDIECSELLPGSANVVQIFSSDEPSTCGAIIPFLGIWSVEEIRILFLGLFGLIAVGIVYGTMTFCMVRDYSVEDALSYFWGRYRAIAILNVLMIVVAAVVVSNVLLGWLSGLALVIIGSDRPFMPYLLNLTMIGASIALLPRWWGSYVFFDEMLTRTRSTPSKRFTDTPFFGLVGPLSSFIAQLLPTSDNRDQIDSVSEPFIQELTKQTLAECMHNFDRVVILVDDIDALPSEKFHELLRLVRPLGKVRGARCVLATPLYFHFALKQRIYGDIHSTVRASVVVGNKAIHEEWPNDPKHITDEIQVLSRFLVDLLISRLRVQLREEDHDELNDVKSAILASSPFRFILMRWITTKKGESFDRITEMFSLFGTSRREIIRELGKSIRPDTREGMDYGVFSDMMGSGNSALEDLKRDYKYQENVLDCDIEDATNSGTSPKRIERSGSEGQRKPIVKRRAAGTRRRGSSRPEEVN